jgi:hypothetical protein
LRGSTLCTGFAYPFTPGISNGVHQRNKCEMNLFHRAEIIFDKIIDYMLLSAAVIVVLMAVVVSEDVISRKFFGFTWVFLYEFITYALLKKFKP